MIRLKDKPFGVLANFDPKSSIILAVDCQNGFTERCPNELPVKGTTEVWISSVNFFLSKAKEKGFKIIASKDEHPEDHMSFGLWPKHCVKGTYGCELFIKDYDFVVKKGTKKEADSYSPYYVDGENETYLNQLLKDNDIKHVIIIGLAGDFCVKAAIEDTIKFGYTPVVIGDFIKLVDENKSMNDIIKEIEEEE